MKLKTKYFILSQKPVGCLPYSVSDSGADCRSVNTASVLCSALSLGPVNLTLIFNQSLPWKWRTSVPAPLPHPFQAPWREIFHPKAQTCRVYSHWQWQAGHSLQWQNTLHCHTGPVTWPPDSVPIFRTRSLYKQDTLRKNSLCFSKWENSAKTWHKTFAYEVIVTLTYHIDIRRKMSQCLYF